MQVAGSVTIRGDTDFSHTMPSLPRKKMHRYFKIETANALLAHRLERQGNRFRFVERPLIILVRTVRLAQER